MVDPASFEELDQAIGQVLDVETTDFFELAEMLGLDPKRDFAGADLSSTDFLKADLSNANFVGTNLRSANLSYSNLEGADLRNAQLGDPEFKIPQNFSMHTRGAAKYKYVSDGMQTGRVTMQRGPSIIAGIALVLGLNNLFSPPREPEPPPTTPPTTPPPRIDSSTPSVRSGANLYRANLSKALLDGADVRGAIMTGCTGLSDSQIADLKSRGAIFDDAPGDRSRNLVPR